MNESNPDRKQIALIVLQLLSPVALAVGAWFFNGLTVQISTLNASISTLNTKVALLARDADRVEEIRADLRSHAAELGHPHGVAAMVERLRADVEALKEQLSSHVSTAGHPVMVDRLATLSARLDQIEASRWTARDHEAYAREVEKRLQRVEGVR